MRIDYCNDRKLIVDVIIKNPVINAHDVHEICADLIFNNINFENNKAPVMMDVENENDIECMLLNVENSVPREIDENSLRYLLALSGKVAVQTL